MTQVWHEANADLENGVITEFRSKLDDNVQPDPAEFRSALAGFRSLRKIMDEHDQALQELLRVDAACAKLAILERTLAGILEESRPFPRLAKTGVRFADAAGLATHRVTPLKTQRDILTALRTDLRILSGTLDEVIAGLEEAMPLTEKGEFSAVMLSGRNAFGDKTPQFTDMFSAYHRLYVQTVLATIATTMQVYPAGYEWLTEPESAAE